jgi:oxepin-CoA hydrolase/3-oxo-5,6-dehydrosuberyl-CoA semialdehyde dehydrogenase
MKVRFDVNDAARRDAFLRSPFPKALLPLQPGETPRWGRMTAPQMVEHLLWTFELSTGRAHVECFIPEERRASMKAFLYHNRPAPPDFENPALREGLPPLRYPGLPEAVGALRLEVERFLAQASTDPAATHTHPLFGSIGADEWSRTHFKHCCHHLLQFGLIDLEK